jgi:hypothetical protein
MDTSPEDRFKTNLLILFEIINDMYEDGINNEVIESRINVLPFIKLYIKRTSSDKLIKKFIKETYQFWDKIKLKNDIYFKEEGLKLFSTIEEKGIDSIKEDEEFKKDNNLTKSLSTDHVVIFKKLLEGSYVFEDENIDVFDDERKEDVWRVMHSFVKISISYIHETRKMVKDDERTSYRIPFMDEIHVVDMATEWKVKLND